MKLIRVECPTCRGIEEIAPSCLLLEVAADHEDDERTAFAAWICAWCSQLVGLPIDLTVLLSLMAMGASLLDTTIDDADVPR